MNIDARIFDAIERRSGATELWAQRCACDGGPQGQRVAGVYRYQGRKYLYMPAVRRRWADTGRWITAPKRVVSVGPCDPADEWPYIVECRKCAGAFLFFPIPGEPGVFPARGALVAKFYAGADEWAVGEACVTYDLAAAAPVGTVADVLVMNLGRGTWAKVAE